MAIARYIHEELGFKGTKLNEASIDTIDPDSFVTKKNIEDVKYDSYKSELFYSSYLEEEGLNDPDMTGLEDWLDEDEQWIRYELESKVHEILNLFKYDVIDEDGYIDIYREMIVDKKWLENLKPGNRLGVYWSYDDSSAEPHWGYGQEGKDVMVSLHGKIHESYVDWKETIDANLKNEEEKEITLFKNTTIILEDIQAYKHMDPNTTVEIKKDLIGKKFRA